MSHYHAVVWLDHKEAHVMHIAPDDIEKSIIHPSGAHQKHLHGKGGVVGSGRAVEDKAYYHAIATALHGATEILVMGPAQAKLALIKHIHAHDKDLVEKIIGVETVDHPTDGQVVAYACKYFAAKDQMLSQT